MARAVIIGCDATFGGWGWAICTSGGPVQVGHVKLNTRSHRWQAVTEFLHGEFEEVIASARLLCRPGDPPPRVVTEIPAKVNTGSFSATITAFGVGSCTGALCLHAARPSLSYPWERRPSEWRKPWGIKGRGRLGKKEGAVKVCRMHGWMHHLEPFPWHAKDGGPQADVAEAILIGVGAARASHLAPRGPAAWGKPIEVGEAPLAKEALP